MRLFFAALLCAFIATPALAADASSPKAIILDVYAHIQKNVEFDPPNSLLTPRLAGLIAGDTADAKGEVGRLDVDFWINGQDGKITKVAAKARPDDLRADRQVVTVTMDNFGKPQTAIFYFEKQGGKWLIDDVRWTGKDGWVLSLAAKYGDGGN
ncbi:MAG TPA: DUF3828 domain-containing protein [Rhizomicrobium sp.]|jgi:hypothetical protein